MTSVTNLKKLLIIAGSDSGGGAGLQADIKTACAHGVYASTAVTAITAQNTKEVSGIFEVSANFVAEQIHLVLEDIGADAIKIGMLANSAIISAVESEIGKQEIPLVLDTVMVAKSGATLLKDNAVAALKSKLMPLAKIVTPNLPEAQILSGVKIKTLEDMVKAGREILKLGSHSVLVKGGHLKGDTVFDVLVTRTKYEVFSHARINAKTTHGTGCTLASAIACHLASGVELVEAVERARNYVIEAIKTAPKIGGGNGPLNHFVKVQ